MSTKTIPTIPPRPARSLHTFFRPKPEMPNIPARPVSRRLERSVSPHRDSYARSPLNEVPNGLNPQRTFSIGGSSSLLPARRHSVNLPSVGQEGMEYADLHYYATLEERGDRTRGEQSVESRNVNRDLHLHTRNASLPMSSDKAEVQMVTRPDSQQAAAPGLGKVVSPDALDCSGRSVPSRTNDSRRGSSTASTDRRASLQFVDEHGIPEIGQRVPMYPNAGDVQAPSPSPYGPTNFSSPCGNNGSQKSGRHHFRTRSGRDVSLPPGSYGLHGHGGPSCDRFEKAWYDKHPDELARAEQGQYGPGLGRQRAEWAMTRDDLNKIVKTSANRGTGLGTSAEIMTTPEEEVGYIATEELASRLSSPPLGIHSHSETTVNSQPAPEAALQTPGSPIADKDIGAAENVREDVIHIDEPFRHQHHPDGFAPAPEDQKATAVSPLDAADLGDETRDDIPILASDEVEPGAEYLQPAITPTFERRGSGCFVTDHDSLGHKSRSQTTSAQSSGPNSRPVSIHATSSSQLRFIFRGEEREEMHTPLENVEEYEPLFPDEGKKTETPPTDRFKQRLEHMKHRFPSQDIWEDAPNSLQLEAAVSTPEVPSQSAGMKGPGLEASGQESGRRKSAAAAKFTSISLESLSHLDNEKRPRLNAKQRFPSRDIWEDAPDCHQLVTTVQALDKEDNTDSAATVASPSFLTHSATNKIDEETKGTPGIPVIPVRPSRRSHQTPTMSEPAAAKTKVTSPSMEARKPPAIPDRPKPQVPLRPANPVVRISDDSQTKTNSSRSADSTSSPHIKAKPAVPTRPVGPRIATLKPGFLSDLDNRLKLGHLGPKPKEKKEMEESIEKGPLSDARKGRARGPARRKPTVSPVSDLRAEPDARQVPEIRIVDPWNVWQVGGDGVLVINEDTMAEKPSESKTTLSSEPSENATSEPSGPSTSRAFSDGKPLSTMESNNDSTSSPLPTTSIEEKAPAVM